MRRLIMIVASLAGIRQSFADGAVIATDTFPYDDGGELALDAGLFTSHPTALPTGLSTGVSAGFSRGRCGLTWGARAAWSTATESTMPWTVSHDDLRLRLTGGLQQLAGRGTIGLRLAAGGTLVHEARRRNQGERAGLSGDELETSTFAMLPSADLDVVIGIRLVGRWALLTSGGPSIALDDGTARIGWTAQLGVAWAP